MPNMIRIENNVPPPISVSEVVRGLKVDQSCVLPGPAESVRSLVSRIKGEFNGKRRYKTRTVGASVRVWRTH